MNEIDSTATHSSDAIASLPLWFKYRWSSGHAAALACAVEAAAPKAGNVHPSAAFRDMSFADFLASGCAIAEPLNEARFRSVGELVLACVECTRSAVGLNTNLGTILLLAPIAKAVEYCRSMGDGERRRPHEKPMLRTLRSAVEVLMTNISATDSQKIYAAIRLANPSGLGNQSSNDVAGEAPADLISAMAQVAETDAVARQYVNGFSDVFDRLVPKLIELIRSDVRILTALCYLQIVWMAREPDGLIVRKCDLGVAREAQRLAQEALKPMSDSISPLDRARHRSESESCGWSRSGEAIQRMPEFAALDSFLRADGHRRNPGTTADLLAVSLFVLLVSDWS